VINAAGLRRRVPKLPHGRVRKSHNPDPTTTPPRYPNNSVLPPKVPSIAREILRANRSRPESFASVVRVDCPIPERRPPRWAEKGAADDTRVAVSVWLIEEPCGEVAEEGGGAGRQAVMSSAFVTRPASKLGL
jgi:hypothetical protein